MLYPRLAPEQPDRDYAVLGPPRKCRHPDGSTIKSTGVYTAGGGEGRGRTKLQLVDWDGKGDGSLDLLVGVRPQGESFFHSSFVLLMRGQGFNAEQEPVFAKAEVLLFGEDGEGLEFWRHAAHPVAVSWQGRGLVVGSDMGTLEYYHEEHFGTAAAGAHERAVRTEAQMARL